MDTDVDHVEGGQKRIFHIGVLGYPDTANGSEETTLQLRNQSTLAENPNLVPGTQVMQLTAFCTFSLRGI